MKKIRNIILWVLGGLLVAGSSGCIPQDNEIKLESEAELAKFTLMQSLENTVAGATESIDQSILNGFTVKKIKEMFIDFEIGEFHPSLREFRKTLNYVLGNPLLLAPGVVEYQVDPKLCIEVIAVNDPASCVSVMNKIRIVQTLGLGATGSVSIYFAENKPLKFTYSANKVALAFYAQEILSTITEIDTKISEELGREEAVLPLQAQGTLEITVNRESMGGVSVTLALPEGLLIQGLDEGHPYTLSLDSEQELATLMFSSMGAIDLTLNTPGGLAQFEVKNNQYVWTPLVLNIPKIVGNVLFSDLERLVKFTAFGFQNRTGMQNSSELLIKSSGTNLLNVYLPLNSMKLSVTQEQTLKVETLEPFNFAIEWFSDLDIFGDEGGIRFTASSGLDAELFVTSPNVYAHVNSGSIQIDGEGVLDGSMNASVNECFDLGNPEGTTDSFPFDLNLCH